jgi:glycosyltransferase involved in cell wall biosynthesis
MVSVVIPTYNGMDFLAETVESAANQTAPPAEIVVINDGSTDGTGDLLRELVHRFPTLRWVTQPNGGEASARNRGIEESRGELIAFLDHDDLWLPQKLERQLAHLEANPSLGVSFSDCEYSGQHFNEWDPHPEAVLSVLSRSSAIASASVAVVRRSALDRVPRFEQLPHFGTDWLMWLRLALAGEEIGYLPETLAVHRWHRANLSASERTFYEAACDVFDRLPNRRWRARWHLEAAIDAQRRAEPDRARSHVLIAARSRPLSIRPGWIRLLA